MKTAGVVLDLYDDPSGSVLRAVFPTPEELPDLVKEAHILTPDERDILRDEAYALVLVNEGKVMRKFACVDAGNTALSTLYFLAHHDKLPAEAVKTACANLLDACEEFRLPTDLLEKVAASHGMARKRDPMNTSAYVGDEADWAQRTNLLSVRGGSDAGRVMSTASTMKTAGVEKEAALFDGSRLAAKMGFKETRAPHEVLMDPMNKKGVPTGKALLQTKTAHVDVTGKEPERVFEKRASKHTALGGRYSLDSFSDVQKAIQYFDETWTEMDPQDRHEFAVKTASRAEELGIDVPDLLGRYGSTCYSPDIEAHLANRKALAPEWNEVWDTLQEKTASIDPEAFALTLAEADKAAGLSHYWGGQVKDPWFATFGGGMKKEASVWSWQGRLGDYVTEDQLKELARNGRGLVHKHFSSDFTTEFLKDPIALFESMPDTSKVILARLANDMLGGGNNN